MSGTLVLGFSPYNLSEDSIAQFRLGVVENVIDFRHF